MFLSLISGEPVGIFPTMITNDLPFYSLSHSLCIGYYTEYSGEKTVSSIFNDYLKRIKELAIDEETPVDDNDIIEATQFIIGQYIGSKFRDKWIKVYNSIISQYNPLVDYEHTENITKNNTDTITYNTNINNTGNRGSKITTTYSDEDNDDIYGFNSSVPVGADTSNSSSTETTEGLSQDNTTSNTEVKTGTDTKNYDVDETKTISGRNKTSAELIDAELDMRNRNIFFNIIFDDIDSVFTLGVYD